MNYSLRLSKVDEKRFLNKGRERERERERIKIMIRMHKTIGKRRILYSNFNTQETNQKPKSSEKETK